MDKLSTIQLARLLKMVCHRFDVVSFDDLSDSGIDVADDRIMDVECIHIIDLLYFLSSELSKRKMLPF